MDNQQGKVRETDIAWLAGFIDGEGCFDFQTSYSKRLIHTRLVPRFRVSNTDVKTLGVVTCIMEAMPIGHHVVWRSPQNVKWRRSWSVEITGIKRMRNLLIMLTPYLNTKQEQAEAMLDFINSRLQGHPKDIYKESEITLINKIKRRKGLL